MDVLAFGRCDDTAAADQDAGDCSLDAAENAADDRADARADAGSLDGLVAAAAGFDSAFIVGASRTLAVNPRDVTVKHASPPVAELDRVESEIHAGPSLNFAGLLNRADVPA